MRLFRHTSCLFSLCIARHSDLLSLRNEPWFDCRLPSSCRCFIMASTRWPVWKTHRHLSMNPINSELPPKKLAMLVEMVFHRERNITLQGCRQIVVGKVVISAYELHFHSFAMRRCIAATIFLQLSDIKRLNRRRETEAHLKRVICTKTIHIQFLVE